MEDFNLHALQPYLFLLAGLGIILFSLFKRSKTARLKLSGEKTQGIIFDLNRNSPSFNPESINNTSNVMNKVTVRFVTKEQEWITGEMKQEFAIFFTGQYKAGETVDVYYDPAKPSNFFIETGQSENKARLFIAAIGMIFCLIGLYQLFATSK